MVDLSKTLPTDGKLIDPEHVGMLSGRLIYTAKKKPAEPISVAEEYSIYPPTNLEGWREVIEQGAKSFNAHYAVWRESNADQKLNLSGMDLSSIKEFRGYDFSDTIMHGIKFSDCDIVDCSFSRADLRGLSISNARVHFTRFDEADLRADATYPTEFSGSTFLGTDFQAADLTSLHLTQNHFDMIDLREAKLMFNNKERITFRFGICSQPFNTPSNVGNYAYIFAPRPIINSKGEVYDAIPHFRAVAALRDVFNIKAVTPYPMSKGVPIEMRDTPCTAFDFHFNTNRPNDNFDERMGIASERASTLRQVLTTALKELKVYDSVIECEKAVAIAVQRVWLSSEACVGLANALKDNPAYVDKIRSHGLRELD